MSRQQTNNKRHSLNSSPILKGRYKLNTATNTTKTPTGSKKLLPGLLIAALLAGASFSLLASCSKEKTESTQATSEPRILATNPTAVAQAPPAPISTEPLAAPETKPVVPSVPGSYPLASTRLLTETDLMDMPKAELKIMRNEIYARHSYRFQNKKNLLFFSNQGWYTPRLDNVYTLLSTLEKTNIAKIKKFEVGR